ncbi:MAG: cupredoxin domain-containing protein [Candidatus Xenobia bacterium]
MGRIADFMRKGVLAGGLAVALLLPGMCFAQGYPAGSTSTTTTVNTSSDQNTMQPGTMNTGSTTTTTTVTSNASTQPLLAYQAIPSNFYTMYNGYESSYDLFNGVLINYGPNGEPIRADFLNNGGNRVLVRMTQDSNMDQLDVARGFDRGQVDDPVFNFNPHLVDIPTGTTVTFYTDEGTHIIDPVDVSGLNESLPIDPSQVFNYTFNQPGYYRVMDGFYGGPTYSQLQGCLIRVTGPNLGANGTLPPSASLYFQQLGLLQPVNVGTSSGVTTQTSTTQTQQEQQTVTPPPVEETTPAPAPTPQMQAQPAPPKPKHQIRNTEVK